MTINLGYACINMTLQQKKKITCNRGMVKKTFLSKGINYASELALENVKSLREIIIWNNQNNIKVFRMTSDLFPWFSEYDLFDMPNIEKISDAMSGIGTIAKNANQRLSFHPGPFNCLGSPNDDVVTKTIKELDAHSAQMDLLAMPATPFSKINIHVGGSYGDHSGTLDRFCKNFEKLSPNAQSRLTVENDDKGSLYSVLMLVEGISNRVGVPVVFDSHHFELGPQDQTYKEAFYSAKKTWDLRGVKQACHHSNSRKNYEDSATPPVSHSDWYYTPFENFGENVDVMLESKMKELALKKYEKDFAYQFSQKNDLVQLSA